MASALVLFALSVLRCSTESTARLPDEPESPATETLCKLVMNTTSLAEAREVLGPARGELANEDLLELYYQYRAPAPALHARLTLRFERETLVDASTINMAFPACWLRDAAIAGRSP